jgi:hypothetical protein
VKESFRPSYSGGSLDVDKFSAIVKSLIEVIRMKNVYQQFSSRDDDHYQAMAQILAKVAEESCLWVSGQSLYGRDKRQLYKQLRTLMMIWDHSG